MCRCLFVEYICSCNKPDCPHHSPRHEQYHTERSLFQTDHFTWQQCARYLASAAIAAGSRDSNSSAVDQAPTASKTRQSLKRLFSTNKIDRNNNSTRKSSVNYRSIDKDGDAITFWSDSSTMESKESVLEVVSYDKQSVQFPVKQSLDPRHGGEMPECDSISYEGWCIERRSCRWCEEYWVGRTSIV